MIPLNYFIAPSSYPRIRITIISLILLGNNALMISLIYAGMKFLIGMFPLAKSNC
jgi:hypothetical protein